jgi:hypothetical protein
MKRLMGFLFGVAALALTVSSASALAATECNTGFPFDPAATPLSGKITGGVVVNANEVCWLKGATISGGVQVNSGGLLFACGSTINGGLASNGAAAIVVGAEEIGCDGDVINGGVEISNTAQGSLVPDTPPSVALENSVIHGAVHLTNNPGRIAVAGDNISGGLFCHNNGFDLEDEHDVGAPPSVITGKVTCKFH